MKRFLLKTLVYFSGVKLYKYYGSQDNLKVVFHKEVKLKNHSTEFKLYECVREETFMRFGKGKKKKMIVYVMNAKFSEEFSEEAKNLNNLKFEINSDYCKLFEKQLVFDILFLNFVGFLNYVLKEK